MNNLKEKETKKDGKKKKQRKMEGGKDGGLGIGALLHWHRHEDTIIQHGDTKNLKKLGHGHD